MGAEAHLGTADARAAFLAFLRTAPELVQSGVFRDTLAERLGKRLAHGGSEAPLDDAARLLALCPPDVADKFLNGILSRLDSGDLPPMPASLREAIERRLAKEGRAPIAVGALRDGDKPAIASALKELSDAKRTPVRRRHEIADALTSVRRPEAIEPLVKLLTSPTTEAKQPLLTALSRYDDVRVPKAIIEHYERAIAADDGLKRPCPTHLGRTARLGPPARRRRR